MIALGNYFFHYRTTLSPMLPLLLLLPGPILLLDAFAAALLGLIVALIGQIVRATTIGLEYIVRGGRNRWVFAETLVTGGLFSHTRNPMYLGKFFMVLGAGIASNRWPALLAIVAAYAFVYHAITLAEEHYLQENSARRSLGIVARCRVGGRALPASSGRWKNALQLGKGARKGIQHTPRLDLAHRIDRPVQRRQTTGLAERPEAAATLWGVLGAVTLFWVLAGCLKKARSPLLSKAD